MTSLSSFASAAQLDSSARPEALPFVVYEAKTIRDISALCELRADCYARHGCRPELAEQLRKYGAIDARALSLVAKDKASGQLLGTLSVHSSLNGTPQVPDGMSLAELSAESFAYLNRFAAVPGAADSRVALALMKAALLWAQQNGICWFAASALPPMARVYRQVGLRQLEGNEGGYKMPQIHNGVYSAMGERVAQIPRTLQRTSPSKAQFLAANHPDIQVGQ